MPADHHDSRALARVLGLDDPNAVHINMLRGTIARPTPEQIVHIYGAEALARVLSAPQPTATPVDVPAPAYGAHQAVAAQVQPGETCPTCGQLVEDISDILARSNEHYEAFLAAGCKPTPVPHEPLTRWAGRIRAQIIAIRRGALPGKASNRNLRGRLGKLVALEADLRAAADALAERDAVIAEARSQALEEAALELERRSRNIDGAPIRSGAYRQAAQIVRTLSPLPSGSRVVVVPPEGSEAREKALSRFATYFRRNYPGPDTIIGDPDWHAPKLFRAALRALTGGDNR